MTTKFLVAQSFGFIGIVVNVLSMHFKTRKNIFTMLFLLNLCSAFNFLFLDRTMSFLVELFGCVEITVNAQFEKRKRRVPVLVVGGYVICVTILAGLAMDSVSDFLLISPVNLILSHRYRIMQEQAQWTKPLCLLLYHAVRPRIKPSTATVNTLPPMTLFL